MNVDKAVQLDLDPEWVEVSVTPSQSAQEKSKTADNKALKPLEREEEREEERAIFHQARQCLTPGPWFRFVTHLYAERKLLIVFWVHLVATLVIWVHFFLIKWQEQENTVPEEANRYWWKRIAPALEFGTMHAILFQMALIPLTMARWTIASLQNTVVRDVFPLNRMLRIHIHLGYVMIATVFAATIFFFAFFGLLCSDGEDAFCDKFTSEIMCTGYGILASLLIIGGTSYLRHVIPYEIFYAIHHLVFIMYVLTIVHTFDNVQRNDERERSQTFKWFSSTLVYYLCDRAAMHLNHRYTCPVVASSAVVSCGSKKKMIILKLRRPALFRFQPGQYAFLKIKDNDVHWHPFSIASGPASDYLEFYMEVMSKEDSWTNKLWRMLEANWDKERGFARKRIFIEVMGPYGTSLAKTQDFSHAIAIGAGTGVVPALSLFKQHVRSLLRLDPQTYFQDQEEHHRKIRNVEMAQEACKGSIAKKMSCCGHTTQKNSYFSLDMSHREARSQLLRSNIQRHSLLRGKRELLVNLKEIRRAASKETRSIYGSIWLSYLPVYGIAVLALGISWNTIPINVYAGMIEFLQVFTAIFHALFVVCAVGIWDGNGLLPKIDLAVSIIGAFAHWYWYLQYEANGTLESFDLIACSLLISYMTCRAWGKTVKCHDSPYRSDVDAERVSTLEKLDFVWVTRSASLVSEIFPDINDIWEGLVAAWGRDNALRVCTISVYVTDKNRQACRLLREQVRATDLYKSGSIHFCRPDFSKLIEDHTLDLICSQRHSYSLVAFCGSPQLARELHQYKISNDMVTAITGNQTHQMEFVSESYGGVKSKKTSNDESDVGIFEDDESPLALRKNTSYFDDDVSPPSSPLQEGRQPPSVRAFGYI